MPRLVAKYSTQNSDLILKIVFNQWFIKDTRIKTYIDSQNFSDFKLFGIFVDFFVAFRISKWIVVKNAHTIHCRRAINKGIQN